MKKIIAIISCCFCYVHPCAQQNPVTDSLITFIKSRGDSLYKAEKVPGIFVGVVNGGRRQYFNFGYAVPDQKQPFDSATLFEAGSITKTFTAYIVTSILQEKKIDENTSIINYLPDSVQANKALQPVSFLNLMNHTSGLPRLPQNMILKPGDMDPYKTYTDKELFVYLKTAQPKPDGKSNYSNLGMGLAGVLAQRITGKDFNSLLNSYVFMPFGMKQQSSAAIKKSQGYFATNKVAYWQMVALAPAGGLQTTADAMLSYLMYMSRPTNPVIKARINKLLQPTVALSPTVQVTHAWHTIEAPGKPIIYWHNGGTYGFSTFAAFIKETGQAVIVVVNRFNTNAVSDTFGINIMQKLLQ